jgi:hypothetical protein
MAHIKNGDHEGDGGMTTKMLRHLFLVLLAVWLSGCAANIRHSPVDMTTAAEPLQRRVLAKQAELRLDSGYSRTLKAGSEWLLAGRLPQGDVYKPYKDVFTLEGANVHEAYLVMSGNELTGFYLPVERGFATLKDRVVLTFN